MKIETSKLILYISYAIAIVLSIIVIFGNVAEKSMSDTTTIASIAWGEVTATNAFYLWKAKNENRSKYAMKLLKDLADKSITDEAIRLSEIIIKD